ncbi:MAG: replication restart helicase PriA, partial [Culicoidibacterales bacterium]
MYVQVIVDLPIQEKAQTYDYRYDGSENLIGYRVAIRVGPQRRQGIVIGMSETTPWDPKKVRLLEKVLDEQPVLNAEQIALAFWLAQTTGSYFYQALQTMLPNAKKLGKKQVVKELKMRVVSQVHEVVLGKGAKKQLEAYEYVSSQSLPVGVTELNQLFGNSAIQALIQKGAFTIEEQTKWRNPYEQYEVLPFIKHPLNEQQAQAVATILASETTVSLLHGITGSGKTEVFMALIDTMLTQNKSTLVLVPEIALTPQIVQRFKARFHTDVAVLHSHLSEGERFDQWRLIEQTNIPIVIGTRSAVFAPVKNLGLVVLDEEHDSSYKQQNQPMYHARDVAIYRAQQNQAKVVLASATPSLESYARAQKARYDLIELTEKAVEKQLTPIEIVDLREEFRQGNLTMLSKVLE